MKAQSTSVETIRSRKEPLLVSHRGGRREYDDNSARGFALSLEHGLRGFETDLHLTADGEIVVMHDSSVERTTDGSGVVEEMTRGEIGRLRLKMSGDPVPFLSDLLEIFRGRGDIMVEFELKSHGGNICGREPPPDEDLPGRRLREYCRKVRDQVASAMPAGTYRFTSFRRDTLAAMREVDPGAPLGLITHELTDDDLGFAREIGAVRVGPRWGRTPEAMVRKAVAAGFEVTLWMIEDAAAYGRAAEWGATGATTDRPFYMFDTLQRTRRTVVIVGAGMMGSALAFPARENGHEVRLVGTPLDRDVIDACRATGRHPKFGKDFPPGVKYYQTEELGEALEGADLVIGGVSSFGVEWFLETALPRIPEKVPVLSVTKGLLDGDDGSLVCYPEYWERRLAERGLRRVLCAVGGPCTSYELVAPDQTEVFFCGTDVAALRMLRDTMATWYYHPSVSTDVRGVESAVALKNAYALGVTLAVGLCQKEFGRDSEQHFNSQAAAFQQGLKEMRDLIRLCGGKDDKLLVGAGDLYVTVYGGRTRRAGILLGGGLTMEQTLAELKGVTLESLVVATRVARAVRRLAERGAGDLSDFPLLAAVDETLNGGKGARIPWDAFRTEDV